MQPVVVVGDASVAQVAVTSGQPGDGTFDHRPVLAVFVEPLGVSCFPSGGSLQGVVWWTLRVLPLTAAVHRVRSRQFRQATPKRLPGR